MIDMRALLVIGIIISVTVTAGVASAQPGNTAPGSWAPPPPPPTTTTGPVAGEKSPGVALGLSLGGTVLSIALASADDGSDPDNTLGTIGGIGVWIAPSFGHWYAGKAWTPGLTARFAGAGAVVIGAVMLIGCYDSEDNGCEDESGGTGIVLLYGGAAAFVGGVVYDIATAPGQARKYNERLRERSTRQWALTPTVSHDHAGLVLGGRF
jgi:hypothetical protein